MAVLPYIELADLPADGLPASAVEAVEEGALFSKRNGYNCVDLAVKTNEVAVDFAVYRYNRDFQGWRPEGPRGTTPTTFSGDLPDNVPIRISVPEVWEYLCVVKTSDGAVEGIEVSLSEANR